ncbi:hypothetical protein BDR26DRAFT_869228 [Obelidium mucronatum]|nr:hypothetical protein BDR26DRAFT_869228 [Obelidium mucronatum]
MYSAPVSPPPGYSSPTQQQFPPGSYAEPPSSPGGNYQGGFPDAQVVDGFFAADNKYPIPYGYYVPVSSGIPTKQVLRREEAVIPYECTAKVHRTTCDVITHDPIIAQDEESLFRYFLWYLREKPAMLVHCYGSHEESRMVAHHTTDSDGHHHTTYRRETYTVTDFDFSIDVSNYIAPEWDQIVAIPKERPSDLYIGEWKAVMEQFTRSKNLLKEIHLQKEICWDYDGVTKSLLTAIRMTGYCHNIKIDYVKTNNVISAHSSSALSKFADNMCVKVMCVVTCLCIVFFPIFLMVRKNVKNQLFAYYLCVGSGRQFYERNVGVVVNSVMNRCKGGVYQAVW